MISLAQLGRRASFPLAIALFLAVAISGGRVQAAGRDCKSVDGKLSVRVTQPLPLQTEGPIIGVLSGTYTFALVDAAASQAPGVSFFDAVSTIHERNGDLAMKEAGSFGPPTPASTTVNIAVLWTIVGGTGVWSGATGQIVALGTVDLAAGSGQFSYRGDVCVP
jgi:hypothetical protein